MHGVRREKFTTTTEEQKEEKRKQRQKKLQAFTQGNKLILEKNSSETFDDEGLKVSAKLLSGNPDVYTFWNYRRKVLEARRTVVIDGVEPSLTEPDLQDFLANKGIDDIRKVLKILPESGDGEKRRVKVLLRNEEAAIALAENLADKGEPQQNGRFSLMATGSDSLESLYQNELALTEQALDKNPKSYSAWHQRGWVLQRMSEPDYQKELKMCNMALKMDERNFHCWDHRRMVCQLAKISPERELEFTGEKVRENFSNYSAWHYRSSLLPVLYPPSVPGLPLDTEALIKELDLAKNAFYTDPEDQSAWFYSRWLTESQVSCDSAADLPLELRSALESQLADCQELAKEEPMNKWPLLIATLCMRRLNSEHRFNEEILRNLDTLASMDSLRRHFYTDMKAKFRKKMEK